MKIPDTALARLDLLEIGHHGEDSPLDGLWTAKADALRLIHKGVSAMIEAAKGSWNRKANAYVFQHDPRPVFEAAILNGTPYGPGSVNIQTPPALAKDLVKLASIETGCQVLEPSAGCGRLVLEIVRLRLPQLFLWAIEIDENRWPQIQGVLGTARTPIDATVKIGDFMTWTPQFLDFDRIVMAPPLGGLADVNHVLKAYSMLRPGGRLVALVSAGALFRLAPLATQLQALVEAHGYKVENDPELFVDSGGGRLRTVTIGIVKPHEAKP